MASLTPGFRLGPYEILSPIGQGGMGEVWKARDTRLDRTVAIKVSQDKFSDRFEREARAVAALNHPHICTLHDVGPNYLVMEYIDGRPLEGPLPLDQALEYAAEICDALDAAHKKGIVHRDLKPGNILVTKSGIKLLDFGLAQISPEATADAAPTTPVTRDGMVIGTLQYMSPEQLEGRKADARSDIYSLGLVLYEMVTGKRAFPLKDLAVLQPAVLERVVKTCLSEDPDLRWQTAREVKLGLNWTVETRTAAVARAPARRLSRARTAWGVATTLLTGFFLVSLWVWPIPTRQAEPPPQPIVRFDLDLGPDASLGPTGPAAILSPDGTRVVFLSQSADGMFRLSTRRLEEPTATPLLGTQGAYAPFFSPDGQSVGFFAAGKLKKTRLDGGAPVELCDAPAGRGATWSEDGSIIAALDPRAGLSRISPDGKVTFLTQRDAGELGHRWPHALPGGKAVLFTSASVPANYDAANIAVVSLEDGRKKTLLKFAGLFPRYLSSGHLVYVTRGTLYAAPFDLAQLEVQGAAKAVLEEVSNNQIVGFAQLDFSRTGTLFYRRGPSQGLTTIHWLDSAGTTEPLRVEAALYNMPRMSADGDRIAYVIAEGGTADIWVYDWRRGSRNKLTSGMGVNTYPLWSPDGRYIVFQSDDGMSWASSDGAHRPEPLTKGRLQTPSSFTSDGKRLLFFQQHAGSGALIQSVEVNNDAGRPKIAEPQLFLETPSSNPFPALSPDGRWVAYASAETGVYEVYVHAFPNKGTRVPVSTSGGNFPMWSSNGREIFYRTDNNQIMVATYTVKGNSFIVSAPRLWTNKRLSNHGLSSNLDLAPDGKRFAVLMPAESPGPAEMQNHATIILNFFDELHRRMATK